MERKRIDFLDGFRGIALLSVILYHSYFRWPNIVPYGSKYASVALFKYGFMGVELFFLISGFVILMSLERSDNFYSFIYKRWIRLFPAMLIATVLVYSTSTFLFERPAGVPTLKSIVPGLLFLEPSWINIITGHKINLLEGSFWSLFVEVKFYIIFGVLYFNLGERKAICVLILLYIISVVCSTVQIKYLGHIAQGLSFGYFGWFASGCLAYLFYSSNRFIYLLGSIGVAAIEIFVHRNDFIQVMFIIAVILLFILPICFKKFRVFTNNRFFIFFGFISYPLYLIHENAMISLIVKLRKFTKVLPDFLLPVLPVIVLSIVAYCIAKYIEPFVRKLIDVRAASASQSLLKWRNRLTNHT